MFFFKKKLDLPLSLSLSLCTMGTLYLVVRLQVCKSQTVMNYDVCCLDVFVPEGCQIYLVLIRNRRLAQTYGLMEMASLQRKNRREAWQWHHSCKEILVALCQEQ